MVVDGSANRPGGARAHITTSIGDQSRYNFGAGAVGLTETGTVAWQVEHRGAVLEVRKDDVVVLSETVDFQLSALAIASVRFDNGTTTLPFGDVIVDFVEVCN